MRRSLTCWAASLLAIVAGCSTSNEEPIGNQVEFSPEPTSSFESLAKSPTTGKPVVVSLPNIRLEIDPDRRDAITALAGCVKWVMQCHSPARSMDDCVTSVPRCTTDTPWMEDSLCCAESCYERYAEARRDGQDDLTSWKQAVLQSSCMPGVQEMQR